MNEFIFILLGFCVWFLHLYMRFYGMFTSSVMVAFVGHGHLKSFEHHFKHTGYDLWAFGHMKRKLSSVYIEPRGNVWQVFKDHSHYKHVLIVEHIRHVPFMFDSNVPVFYFHRDQQVASLWPRLEQLPHTNRNFTSFIKENNIEIEKIYI